MSQNLSELQDRIRHLEALVAAVPIALHETGASVECSTCGRRKKPVGRSAPMEMANGLCDQDCDGYREHPEPGDLWPGETRIEFGFPKWLCAIAAEQERMREKKAEHAGSDLSLEKLPQWKLDAHKNLLDQIEHAGPRDEPAAPQTPD